MLTLTEKIQKPLIYFMHINKTAGSSIHQWLKNAGLESILVPSLEGFHQPPNVFDPQLNYLTVVRNPYDRLASHFFQWQKQKLWKPSIKNVNNMIEAFANTQFMSKEEKINNLMVNQPALHSNFNEHLMYPCADWMPDFSKFKIFKFEELTKLEEYFKTNYNFANQKLNLSDVVVSKTSTKRLKSYSHLYNDRSVEWIQQRFHDDFVLFKYKK